MRNHKSRYYWAKYNNYGFCQTGQLIHAVHVYLGHTFTLPSTSRKTFEQEYYPYWKRILDCDLSIWVAVKNVQNCQVKTRWCLLPEKFWPQKNVRIFNISKFSPKKHQKDRGDPQMAGQCYLIFTLSDPVIESDLRQLNSACSLKRAQFGNKTNCKNGPIHI